MSAFRRSRSASLALALAVVTGVGLGVFPPRADGQGLQRQSLGDTDPGTFSSYAGVQELRKQPHARSAYLDLRPTTPGSAAQSTPAWIESIDFVPAPITPADSVPPLDGTASATASRRAVYRIHLQPPEGSASDNLQARVFFQDAATGLRPTISAWNELGICVLAPVSLGQNLGLPSSETLTLPMHGADYIEVEADGDGAQVRGIFLTWLEPTEVLQPSDFRARDTVRQPFHILSATRTPKDDSYLYGVVTASLSTGKPLVLKPADGPLPPLQFELERQPLVAVVTCEVLGASIDAPPTLTVNGQPDGQFSFVLPDFADPGYQGISREAQTALGFRYTGWLHAQKIIPGGHLSTGLNNLGLGLSNLTDSVAIRSVSIQLKYNWEKLDYVLAPSATTDENP